MELDDDEAFAMRLRARKSSWRFSEQVFSEAWTKHLQFLVEMAGPTDGKKDL